MIGLVVTGHGHFADGIHTSAQMIAGENDYVRYINFEEGMTPEQLAEKFNAAFDEFKSCDGVVVLSDLPGGSPFKTAVECKNARPEQKIEVIAGTNLLTYTTSPFVLTDAIEQLLKPLGRLHFPVHELAMMMSIALRFIPTLIEETDKIMNAQKARGAMLDSGTMTERIKALVPVLIPLFISAFRRADELAMAMECRCYRGGDGRTRLKVLRCTRQDYIDLAVCIVCFALILSSRLVFPNF